MAMLLAVGSAADYADQRKGSWAFERALFRHRRKRIVVANEDLRRVFSWSGGSRVAELQPLTNCRMRQTCCSFRNFASFDHFRSNYLQYDLQYRVKRDVIIRNQKNTFRNSMKLLEPEESDQRKVIIFPGDFCWSENRAP